MFSPPTAFTPAEAVGGENMRLILLARVCQPGDNRGQPLEASCQRGSTMRGRRPAGPEIVEQLHGSAQARQRLRVVLETLAGRLRLQDACQQLGIGPVRFHTLRQAVLEAALAALEPRPVGRPPRDDDAAALAGPVEDMAAALEASRLREEVALILTPRHAPAEAGPGKKKRTRSRPDRPRKRRTGSG